ncbi:hypothetical protein ACFVXQ_08820 [Kitasatospora sp. NPDC058263]
MKNIDGTRFVTRPELRAATGLSDATLFRLWAERDTNGHPPAATIDGLMHWPLRIWRGWYADHQAAGQKARNVESRPVASGRRDELIPPAEFAKILGHRDTTTLSRWLKDAPANYPPGFPEPDAWTELTTRRRPEWKRHRAEAFAKVAPTRGSRGGRRTGGGRALAHPYQGDPRLDIARRLLDEHPGLSIPELTALARAEADTPASEPTWRRIIEAARQL